MYKFYYLKYLFIILPGTLAGEWMLGHSKAKNEEGNKRLLLLLSLLCFGIIFLNVALLYSRLLILNVGLTIAMLVASYYLMKTAAPVNSLLRNFLSAGAYILLFGLTFEAYEGGIHKDFSTYSYYFVTSGLAFFMLIGFYCLALSKIGVSIINYLSLNGRNPMVAYVAGNLLLLPVLHITGLIKVFDGMNGNPWIGFLRGVLFTGIVSLITILFTKRGWFWKT
jgi:predicted acyltransferase